MANKQFIDRTEEEIKNLNETRNKVARNLQSIDRIYKNSNLYPNLEEDIEVRIDSTSSHLQSYYTGFENIFNRVTAKIDCSQIEKSANWHQQLLDRMAEPWKNIRPAVISQKNFKHLKELKNFRHFIRSNYTIKLDYDKVILNARDHLVIPHQSLIYEIKEFASTVQPEQKDNQPIKTQQQNEINGNRQLYLKYKQQLAQNIPPSAEDLTSTEDRELDVKIARKIATEFTGTEKADSNQIYKVLAQSDRALFLKKSSGKPAVRKYLDSIIAVVREANAVQQPETSTEAVLLTYQKQIARRQAQKPAINAIATQLKTLIDTENTEMIALSSYNASWDKARQKLTLTKGNNVIMIAELQSNDSWESCVIPLDSPGLQPKDIEFFQQLEPEVAQNPEQQMSSAPASQREMPTPKKSENEL